MEVQVIHKPSNQATFTQGELKVLKTKQRDCFKYCKIE